MLLDDSIELDYNDYSASAEALPMNWDINLSNIYIPSSLLPNRKKPINPNENKPFCLYTLEKPDYSKTFSIYADESPQYHEPQTSLVHLSKISHHKLIDNNIDKLHISQTWPSSQNAAESNGRSGIESKKEISQRHPDNKNELDNSSRGFLQAYNSINVVQCGKNTSGTYSVQEARCKASLEVLTRRMAEILSEEEPFIENRHHEDITKTNQVTIGSSLDSILSSAKDSLEELYFSEDENQFDEYKPEDALIDSPEKEHVRNIYINNSNVQELPSKSCVNNYSDLELTSKGSDKIVMQSLEETEKILHGNRKIAVDIAFNRTEQHETNEIGYAVHTEDSKQDMLNYEREFPDTTAKVVEFPIAYKKPPIQDHANKTKLQKEKKKSKKAKVNIPLEDLFKSEKNERFQTPEVDEFYENLIRQGKCNPLDEESNINAFSFVNLPENIQTKVLEFPSVNLTEKSQNISDFEQKIIQSLSCEPQSNSLDEKIEPENESKIPLDTIIIDNIPLYVTKENIKSFILAYGELKNLTIEQHGKIQRAILKMDFIFDVDWIIDCLNDSQPFGSLDAELIKCYRQP